MFGLRGLALPIYILSCYIWAEGFGIADLYTIFYIWAEGFGIADLYTIFYIWAEGFGIADLYTIFYVWAEGFGIADLYTIIFIMYSYINLSFTYIVHPWNKSSKIVMLYKYIILK